MSSHSEAERRPIAVILSETITLRFRMINVPGFPPVIANSPSSVPPPEWPK